MPDCAVGIMAKYPQPGCVKTRLAADIGDEEALRVYLELLTRAVRVLGDTDGSDVVRVGFVTPPECLDQFATEYPGLDRYLSQTDGDLGVRMSHALHALLDRPDTRKAILIGTDIPELSCEILAQASANLDSHDLVIGPTYDGGYYLIGMRRVHEELFQDVVWGGDSVLEKSLEIADNLGLSVHLLTRLRDLDNSQDLKQLTAAGVICTTHKC